MNIKIGANAIGIKTVTVLGTKANIAATRVIVQPLIMNEFCAILVMMFCIISRCLIFLSIGASFGNNYLSKRLKHR